LPLTPGDGARIGDASRTLVFADVFKTYTLTVYWEQDLGGGFRRLLRSTHVFGAGDHEATSSVFILPASAQIEDAVESLDASTEHATTAAPESTAEDKGLSGAAIAAIIAGGVVVGGGLAYFAVQAGGVSVSVGNAGKKRPYSAVRRSERFSTMNF